MSNSDKRTNNEIKDTSPPPKLTQFKSSFDPISVPNIEILILGSLPGEKSLEFHEYYAHPNNKFWKIIATITNDKIPSNYTEKKELLIKHKMGVWDIAHQAIRQGSLDSAIHDEEPNDLNTFISKHKHLKIIGFNGLKSESLYDKYFIRKPDIQYIVLPSSSPANASTSFEQKCKAWSQLITNK